MLRRNLPLKATAVLFAISLWFWVMFSEQNPLAQKSVQVQVTPAGASVDLIASPGSATVRVTVRGLEQDLSDLTSVTAQVNCRGLSAGRHRVTITAKVPKDVTIISLRPPQMTVLLEEIVSESQPVEVKLTGESLGNYKIQEVRRSPEIVRVSGADSLVTRVKRVRARADLSRLVPGVPVSVEVQPLDEAGKVVGGVTVTPPRIKVTALTEHTMVTKVVPVILRTRGVLPEGLSVESAQVDSPLVTVIALAEQAEAIKSIDTEALSLASLRATSSRELQLIVPEGVSLAQEPRVRVTIKVREQGEPVPAAGE